MSGAVAERLKELELQSRSGATTPFVGLNPTGSAIPNLTGTPLTATTASGATSLGRSHKTGLLRPPSFWLTGRERSKPNDVLLLL